MVPLTIRCGLAALSIAAFGCATAPAVSDPAPSLPADSTAEVEVDEEARPVKQLDDDGVFYVLGTDPAKPAVRYRDGHRSLNETCAVQLGNKLNRRIPPAYVNGQPVGFC